ncbi:thioredoxin [Penicillium verhagenii]|uniref:thioredoxin n=1 Tax=Penicillium verhagenii TaxID=1562060 RepID=UPI002545143A|nr:thioredoxin [Penicillium verhagenii]KAJ5928640.1 thioredoxin [Penicillium verhagenii]
MSMLTETTSRADLSSQLEALSPSALLVLYFYTPWTEYSTKLRPLLSSIASQCPTTTPPTISFLSINAKNLLEISKEYGVSKAPCIVYLRNGQILESIKGSDLTEVCNALRRYTGISTKIPLSPDQSAHPLELSEALITHLTELVRTAPVMLFMKGTPNSPLCRFSRRLVGILNENNISYDSFNILTDEDVRQGLKGFGDWPTFPQLWVNGEMVGGLDIASSSDYRI